MARKMEVVAKLWYQLHDRKLTLQLWSLHKSYLRVQLPGSHFSQPPKKLTEFFKAMRVINMKNNTKIKLILWKLLFMRYKTLEIRNMPIMDYAEVQKEKKWNDGCQCYWAQTW